MDNIEDTKRECERYRLLYKNADKSLAYWEAKCRRLENENIKANKILQEISKYAIDLINGVKSGCEDDIGTILLEIVNKVTGE